MRGKKVVDNYFDGARESILDIMGEYKYMSNIKYKICIVADVLGWAFDHIAQKINPSKWGICGGKVNLGENLIDACIRETSEEIGIELRRDELKFLSNSRSEKGYFTIYYTRKNIDIKQCKIQEKELQELKYFKIEELSNLDNEGFEWLESLFIKIHKNTL